MRYLVENYPKSSSIKKITQDIILDKLKCNFIFNNAQNTDNIEQILLAYHKENKFIINIVKIILELINHTDYNNQSVYNTDYYRNNYIIKIGNKWIIDKKGIRFIENIIKPIIQYIKQIISDYKTDYYNKNILDKKISKINVKNLFYNDIICFEKYLLNETIYQDILSNINTYIRFCDKAILETEKDLINTIFNDKTHKITHKDIDDTDNFIDIIDNCTDDNNYVYMIQLREFLTTNIIKIGRTKQHNMNRIKSYPKGSLLLLYVKCNDCIKTEYNIITSFKELYIQKTEYGTEYFEGDVKSMMKDFFELSYE